MAELDWSKTLYGPLPLSLAPSFKLGSYVYSRVGKATNFDASSSHQRLSASSMKRSPTHGEPMHETTQSPSMELSLALRRTYRRL